MSHEFFKKFAAAVQLYRRPAQFRDELAAVESLRTVGLAEAEYWPCAELIQAVRQAARSADDLMQQAETVYLKIYPWWYRVFLRFF